MNFNKHPELAGKHSTLSASKYHWIRYSNEKLLTWFRTQLAAREGTELHDLAAFLIRKGVKLPRNNKTLNLYVNDAIGFRMTPEQGLFYSIHAFGTVDAIVYRTINGVTELRIHDLKTGVSKASMDQLMIYVAYFCLEYDVRPADIDLIELRIYQNDDYEPFFPERDEIVYIMDRIVTGDRLLSEMIVEVFG